MVVTPSNITEQAIRGITETTPAQIVKCRVFTGCSFLIKMLPVAHESPAQSVNINPINVTLAPASQPIIIKPITAMAKPNKVCGLINSFNIKAPIIMVKKACDCITKEASPAGIPK